MPAPMEWLDPRHRALLGWAALGAEGHALATGLGAAGADAVGTGRDGAPRGTLYAAAAFAEALGVRFWAPNATSLPPAVASIPKAIVAAAALSSSAASSVISRVG